MHLRTSIEVDQNKCTRIITGHRLYPADEPGVSAGTVWREEGEEEGERNNTTTKKKNRGGEE